MNKELLQYLADNLRKWPGEKFNYCSWAESTQIPWEDKVDLSHCGSTCCALGLAATLPLFQQMGMSLEKRPDNSKLAFVKVKDRPVNYFSPMEEEIINDHETSIQSAMFIFDLTKKETKYLFIPENYLSSYDMMGPGDEATPNDVADHIEYFINYYSPLPESDD